MMRHLITKSKIFIVVVILSIFLYYPFYLDKYPDEHEYKGNETDKSAEDKGFKIFRDVKEFFVGQERAPEDAYEYSKQRLFQNIENIVDKEHKLILQSDLEQLEKDDGFSVWRKQESADLSHQVQSALHHLQNPPDCNNSKKLVCHMTFGGCAFGCLLHHAVYCLITALATRRVLIIPDEPWHYNNHSAIKFLSPISASCLEFEGPAIYTNQVSPDDNATVVAYIPDFDQMMANNNSYSPPALPAGLAKRIFKITRDPDAWWVGQMLAYLMRPNAKQQNRLDDAKKIINFSLPVVGVQVRRGDKMASPEGRAHELGEYMEHVEHWFKNFEMKNPPTKRRIYLATDDPQVLTEVHEKYPQYEVFDNPGITDTVAKGRLEDTDESFEGLIQDVHMLSLTDYVVCTYSSNICCMVYQLMLFNMGDAGGKIHSIDLPWWYLYRQHMLFVPIMEDQSMNLKYGDELLVDTRLLDAVVKQTADQTSVETRNERTKEVHMIPLNKLRRIHKLFNFTILDNFS